MKTGYADAKAPLLRRMTRAEGQVRGIARMIAEDTYCIDVLTQISAVQAALDKVALELLRDHARHCLNDDAGMAKSRSSGFSDGTADKADELVGAISRMLSR